MPEMCAPKRQYTNKFKVEAVGLAESVGQHEAALRLGAPVATLGNRTWRGRCSDGIGPASDHEAVTARAARPRRTQANGVPDAVVAALHRESRGSYGRPRFMRQLRARAGRRVPNGYVAACNARGLRPIYKHPYRKTADSTHRLPAAPNLLEWRFDGWQQSQVDCRMTCCT